MLYRLLNVSDIYLDSRLTSIVQSTVKPVSSEQLLRLLPDCVKDNRLKDNFITVDCRLVEGGNVVGFKRNFNSAENKVLLEPRFGVIAKHMPRAVTYHNRAEPNRTTRNRKTNKAISVSGNLLVQWETIWELKCSVHSCNVVGRIVRVQCGEMTGLLYQEHEDHQEHHHVSKPGASPKCLTPLQEDYIIEHLAGNSKVSNAQIKTLVDRMIDIGPDLPCSEEQREDKSVFRQKVHEFIDNSMRSNSGVQHFAESIFDTELMTCAEFHR